MRIKPAIRIANSYMAIPSSGGDLALVLLLLIRKRAAVKKTWG